METGGSKGLGGAAMPYILLAVAIACEIGATTMLKYSKGFTVLAPSAATLALYGASFFLFSKVLTAMDLATAYATWCAVGIVATTAISIVAFHDRMSAPGLAGIALTIAGVVIVNLNPPA